MSDARAAAPGGLSCPELVELVTDYLENALPTELRRRFEFHLERCDGCKGYLAQMRQTLSLLGRLREEELDQNTRNELMKAFRDWSPHR